MKMKLRLKLKFLIVCLSIPILLSCGNSVKADHLKKITSKKAIQTEICVYGGTPGGVTAAIQAAKMGKSVLLIEPSRHLGGIMVNGLGGTDINNHSEFDNDAAVGGLALEFYKKIFDHYGIENWQERREDASIWNFESSVADSIIKAWVSEHDIKVLYESRLKLGQESVRKEDGFIKEIKLESGQVVRADMFIDATIEGDLVHFAGIDTYIGRESNAKYGETKNGIRGTNTYRQFEVRVDPYNIPGDSTSGVIPTIQDEPLGTPGAGDHRIQAYCYRVCLTQKEDNKVPFNRPEGYDRDEYEIYLRYLEAGGDLYRPSAGLPNGKTDLGVWHDLSHNLYGMNHEYPGGDYQTREKIRKQHRVFTQGLFYFLANDKEVPEEVRNDWGSWGLCKDEFTDNNNWPRKFYVRDGRRMVSDYVITEHHTKRINPTPVPDPVGVAYWPPDVHHVRRIIRDGAAYNEGFVFGGDDWGPFGISYRALIPPENQAKNLLTPTVLSASHIGYGAIRLEWTYMVLGQSAGTAAVLALENGISVQEVEYDQLHKQLLKDGQVLEVPPRKLK
ncbi:FAD-dependent oxidoreductase [Halalkalibaculum sp. DA3122]|uniref:FAD-dependent oxidoreductase n=1 Tax=Halalkalibaculum sp. DA3122 TaxID=3373607 RepID=UPI003754B540